MQAPSGIDDEHIGMRTATLVQSPLHYRLGFFGAGTVTMHRTDFPGERLQLQNGRRPMDVDADQHDAFLVGFDQPLGKLRGSCRLARALQTDQKYHNRRLCLQIQRFMDVAKQSREFVMDNLYERLARRQAFTNLFPDHALPDAFDERPDDGQCDVGFEESEPDLTQRILDIGLAQSTLTAQIACGLCQAVGEVVKHR